MEAAIDFIFLGSKITADGDCSHDIKRRLLLGRKAIKKPAAAAKSLQSCLTLCDLSAHVPQPGFVIPGSEGKGLAVRGPGRRGDMCGPRRRVREARGDGAGALTPATEEKRSICEVCCSATKSCPILCDPLNCSMLGSPSFSISQSLLKLMSVESVMPSSRLVLCRPLLLPSGFPSIRGFSNESALCIRWPKY